MTIIHYAFLVGTVLTTLTSHTNHDPCKVVVQAKWQNLENNPKRIKRFGGKWILVGSIVFKKRSSDIIYLDEIQLTWKGKPIDNLVGSLYEKHDMSSFLPIEKYLICDSQWKQSTQQLLLRFNNPLTLGAVNTFYLVLTVPQNIEPILKKGHFAVEQAGLPFPYRQYVKENNLSITLNTLPLSSTST